MSVFLNQGINYSITKKNPEIIFGLKYTTSEKKHKPNVLDLVSDKNTVANSK